MASELKTYGDLKKLLNYIKLKQKGGKIISQGKEFFIDQILGLIPGASNAKTAFDFFQATFGKPDTVKTNTWLDRLDIDDQISKIVDDTVENSFLENLSKSLGSVPNDKNLEDDFDINKKLQEYLKQKFKNRTIIVPEGYIYNKNKNMSKLNKLIKENINNLLEGSEMFDDMTVAFGVKHKSNNLSDAEKNQFGPMGQLKTDKGGSFENPNFPGKTITDKSKKEAGKEAQAYYKEVLKKVQDYQIPNDEEEFDAPKIPTNTSDSETENERLKLTGYDTGVSGMEVVMDRAAKSGGSEATKKKYKERMDKLQGDKMNYDYMKKSARKTNDLKYTKDAQNGRPIKSQTSKQPENLDENFLMEIKSSADVEKLYKYMQDYVLNKYPQLKEKVDQPTEKAQIIALFAKEFGINPQQLGMVKSIIDKSNKESNKTEKEEPQPQQQENTFKVKGKLVSEEQVIKLANKVPSRIKIDETTFAITDGENTYKMIWEGDSETGEPVITNFKNNQMVNEDIQKMKHLWGFKTKDNYETKKNITENGDEAFRRIFKMVKNK